MVTGGNDGVVRVWSLDRTPTGKPELRASLRHHSFAVTQIIPAPAGFGESDESSRRPGAGVHGGGGRFVFTADASGALGLVDVERGRCEVFIPGVPGFPRDGRAGRRRERLVELLLDVGRGALALRYEGYEGTGPRYDKGGTLEGTSSFDPAFIRVRVWDLFGGGAMDRTSSTPPRPRSRPRCVRRATARAPRLSVVVASFRAWRRREILLSTKIPSPAARERGLDAAGAPYVIANAAHLLNAVEREGGSRGTGVNRTGSRRRGSQRGGVARVAAHRGGDVQWRRRPPTPPPHAALRAKATRVLPNACVGAGGAVTMGWPVAREASRRPRRRDDDAHLWGSTTTRRTRRFERWRSMRARRRSPRWSRARAATRAMRVPPTGTGTGPGQGQGQGQGPGRSRVRSRVQRVCSSASPPDAGRGLASPALRFAPRLDRSSPSPAPARLAVARRLPRGQRFAPASEASGLEAWGAFGDAFEDALEVFRDISDPTSGPPPGVPGRVHRRGGVPREPPGRTPRCPPSWLPRSSS